MKMLILALLIFKPAQLFNFAQQIEKSAIPETIAIELHIYIIINIQCVTRT
jgi:hypothetical protein